MTDEEKEYYHKKVLFHLYDNGNHNLKNSQKLYELMTQLDIPKSEHRAIYHTLYGVRPPLINGNPGLDPEVWLNEFGMKRAEEIKKEEVHSFIEEYKDNALRAIKEHGIGTEVFWDSIAQKAEIPQEHQEDIKNILIEDGFIWVTTQTQSGDLIKGQSKISGYLLGRKSIHKISAVLDQSTHVYGDGNKVATGSSTLTDIERDSTPSTIPIEKGINRKSLLRWESIIGILTIASFVFTAGYYFGERKADLKNIELRQEIKDLEKKLRSAPSIDKASDIKSNDTSRIKDGIREDTTQSLK